MANLSPQRRFGDYLLVDHIGQGGMGLVFSARLEDSERLVALKLGPEGARLDDHRLERFRREGEITGSLRHPNIVPVHDAGVVDGRPFLAYQLVDGAKTLRDTIPHWPLRRRIEALRDVARALGHAHERGVVHRDVKPENVLVTEEGTVLLADFGLASAATLDRITQTQAILGTPLYMAPELICEGAAGVCPQSDVYALGVMLYEALVGEHPYADGGLSAVMEPDNRKFSAPARRTSEAPSLLSMACMRALQREPSRRFAHGDAMADTLQAWLDGATAKRSPVPLALVGIAAVGVAALAFSPAPEAERPPTPASSSPVAVVSSLESPVAPRRERTPAQAATLRTALELLETSAALNAPNLLEGLQRLQGTLGPDELEGVALTDGVVRLLLDQQCQWKTWGLPALQALAATGARPSERRRAQTLCEQMWLVAQTGDFPIERIELGLRALVVMDVDIDAGSVVFTRLAPRPPQGTEPVERYVKLRGRLSKLKHPKRAWLYQDLLAMGDEARLGPVTRARALSLGLRSVSDPAQAVTIARRARRLDPQSGHVHLALAQALLAAGEDRKLEEHERAWARWRADHRGRTGGIEYEERLLHHSLRLLVNRGQVDEAMAFTRAFGASYRVRPPGVPRLLKRLQRAKQGTMTPLDADWFRKGFVRPGR